MGNRFASGKYSIAQCDRCDGRYKLHELRIEIVKTKPYQLKVCNECWDPDHPQLQLGMYPVDDPQGVMDPRPDRSYWSSGTTGLQIQQGNSTSVLEQGFQGEGSRDIQWGWNPVGGARSIDNGVTPNYLAMAALVGTVTVAIS
jgi:hypothetical protein